MATAAKTGHKIKDHGKRRMLNGKVVKPVLYNGRAYGHGCYYAGMVEGENKEATYWDNLVKDEDGRPLQLKEIGTVQ